MTMVKVTISGWRDGLDKVQLNHLLRHHTGCGLADAKRAVDELLSGGTLTYDFPNSESANDFRLSVRAVGADCAVLADEPLSVPSPSVASN